MTAAKALTWDQPLYYIPTRVTGQTVVSSSRRLPVVRTETRGKITYLHFNISTNDQTMTKAWPASVIERINPMPDETNDTNEDTAQDAINGETQPVEVEAVSPESKLVAPDDQPIDYWERLEAEDIAANTPETNPRGVTVAQAEASISKVRQNIAQTASETPGAVPADDAPEVAVVGVEADTTGFHGPGPYSAAPDASDDYIRIKTLWQRARPDSESARQIDTELAEWLNDDWLLVHEQWVVIEDGLYRVVRLEWWSGK